MGPTSQGEPERDRRARKRLNLAGALAGFAIAAAYAVSSRAVVPLSLCGPKPSNPCVSTWVCQDGTWEPVGFKAPGTACSDGNLCTSNDRCDGQGNCLGTPTCQALNDCQVASCNRSTGACSYTWKQNGTQCSDGNACTRSDSCQAGACVGSSPVTCTALDQCHLIGTCNAATGVCSNPLKPAGSPCGLPCRDSCNTSGQCVSGTLAPRGTACPLPTTCGQVCDGISPYCQPAE